MAESSGHFDRVSFKINHKEVKYSKYVAVVFVIYQQFMIVILPNPDLDFQSCLAERDVKITLTLSSSVNFLLSSSQCAEKSIYHFDEINTIV